MLGKYSDVIKFASYQEALACVRAWLDYMKKHFATFDLDTLNIYKNDSVSFIDITKHLHYCAEVIFLVDYDEHDKID